RAHAPARPPARARVLRRCAVPQGGDGRGDEAPVPCVVAISRDLKPLSSNAPGPALRARAVHRAASRRQPARRAQARRLVAAVGLGRAAAAGGGAGALWRNAGALFQGGDLRAAGAALHLWATQVPDGLERLSDARAELFVDKRDA